MGVLVPEPEGVRAMGAIVECFVFGCVAIGRCGDFKKLQPARSAVMWRPEWVSERVRNQRVDQVSKLQL